MDERAQYSALLALGRAEPNEIASSPLGTKEAMKCNGVSWWLTASLHPYFVCAWWGTDSTNTWQVGFRTLRNPNPGRTALHNVNLLERVQV